MRLSQEFIDRVRDATNIVELISSHTQLKRSGSNLSGLCPFPDHKEKTPSFSVSENKQAYYCFGCKRGGNVFTFLRDYQGLTFIEAVELLAGRASIPLPEQAADPRAQAQDEKRKSFLRLNREVSLFFRDRLHSLKSEHPVWKYIERRGLSAETVDQFVIGYAPPGWEELTQHLNRKKVPMDLAESLGLVKRKSGGHFDIFRDRLMFPIVSPMGEVLGFGGRILGDGQPKYLNSSDSPVFSKGKVFYGLQESSKFIRTEDHAIVVEGYMDFLALFQAGVKNVVATLGTALTEDHARLLKRYTKNVVVLFDGDAAGQTASDRSLPILLSAGLLPRGFVLPQGVDPDDYVKSQGGEKLKLLLKEAPDLFGIYLTRLQKKYGAGSTQKVRMMEELRTILLKVADDQLKSLYVEEVSSRLGVKPQWVLESVKKVPPVNLVTPDRNTLGTRSAPTARPPVARAPPKSRPKDELWLINMALKSEEHLKQIAASGVVENLSDLELRAILDRILQLYGQRPNDFDKLTTILSSQVDDPSVLTQHLDSRSFDLNDEKGNQLVRDCIQKVKERFLKSRAKAIMNELKSQQDPEKLEQFVNVLKDRRALENE